MGSHSLDSCRKGSSRSSLQAQGETTMVLEKHHRPPWDGTDLGCIAASLPLSPRALDRPARPAPAQFCYSHTMQPWHRSPVIATQERPKGLTSARLPTVSFQVFFLSVGCCKSQPTFHLLHVGIEFIPCANHRALSPQNPSVIAVFPETRLYILPIPTQYHLCSPRACKLLHSHHQGTSYDPSESPQGFSYERSKFRAGMQTSFTDPESMLSAPMGPFCRHPAQRGDSREASLLETLWNANTSEWLFFLISQKIRR